MKTLILKLGLIASLLFITIQSFAYDFEVDGIYYNIISFTGMTCEVVSTEYQGDVIIPAEVTYNSRNLKVTSIGNSAFKNCSSLASVTIPESVTSIGSAAFYLCSALASVSIPNSVTSIGDEAFYLCSSLTSVTIPNSVTSIGYEAFYKCGSLTSVTIPNSVTSIDYSAFYGCSSLESIKLSDNLEYIDYGLFYECEKLEVLDVPGSVNRISQYCEQNQYQLDTFYGCSSLNKLILQYSSNSLQVGYFYKNRYFPNENEYRLSDWYTSWTDNITELYIDRNLDKEIPVKNLTKLEIGESVETIQVKDIVYNKSLETIYSYAKTPPTLRPMSHKHYMNTIVKVPAEALEAYKNADSWKNFWNLSAMESSYIEEINAEATRKIIGRYDLNGNRVDENYKGITIVRFSDGSSRKSINNATL